MSKLSLFCGNNLRITTTYAAVTVAFTRPVNQWTHKPLSTKFTLLFPAFQHRQHELRAELWKKTELCVLLSFCISSAAHMGELLQCEMGHQGAGHIHRRQAAGPRPHHHHGHRADLQGWARQHHSTCLCCFVWKQKKKWGHLQKFGAVQTARGRHRGQWVSGALT